jgi:hypothetical protein
MNKQPGLIKSRSLPSFKQISLIALLFALIGGYIVYKSFAAGTTVYVAQNGNDSSSCTQAAPCASFSRAYQVATAGATVEVGNGTYGGQSLVNLAPKSTTDLITFRPAAGATVAIGYLNVSNSQNIEIRDMSTKGWEVINGSKHVVYRNLTANNLTDGAYFSGADDVQIIGGEIGFIDPGDAIHFNNDKGINTNITIDGIYVHDLTFNLDPTSHDDCIQTGDVRGLTIKNSKFMNCGTQGLYISPYGSGVTQNVTIENNWLGVAQLGSYILNIGDISGPEGVTVRNNSFTGWANTYNSSSSTHLRVIGNIFGNWASYNCGQFAGLSQEFSYNVVPVTGCGGNNTTVASNVMTGYVNGNTSSYSAFDLHLKAGAVAIDKGNPGNYPSTDIDGQARYSGSGPDAGADELITGTTTPKVGDLNSDGRVDVADLSILLSHFGSSYPAGELDTPSNGVIGISDIGVLLSHFGS